MSQTSVLEVPAKTFWVLVAYLESKSIFQIGEVILPDQPREQRLAALFRLRPHDVDLPPGASEDEVIAAALIRGLDYCPEAVVNKLCGVKSNPERFGTYLVAPIGPHSYRLLWVRKDGVIAPVDRPHAVSLHSVKGWMVVMSHAGDSHPKAPSRL